MKLAASVILWVSIFLIVYTYLLYPIVLFLIYSVVQAMRDMKYLVVRRDRRVQTDVRRLPAVSLVIAAHNEELHLPATIENLLRLDYPRELLEIVIVSDGSDDHTNEILLGAPPDRIRAVILSQRGGKANALNAGVEQASHEILVFGDASTLFDRDAMQNLVRHFQDPKVGVACGFLKFKATVESQQTEGVYWKYETILRLMEARLGATMTASGAIYALRKASFQKLSNDVVIEDFVIPMRVRKMGYSVVFDPEAVGIEYAAPSVKGEFTRRVRLALGSFRALSELIIVPLDAPARLAFFSHKLLRWMVPFLLIFALTANAVLAGVPGYRALLIAQMTLYVWAAAGFLFHERMRKIRFGLLGYFWLAMNLAFLVGFWRFIAGRQGSAWQRVE
jgi:cellulose synthase/poly-beta-1,6-N-acetylglucosamine synthase-like glycosyltransferase